MNDQEYGRDSRRFRGERSEDILDPEQQSELQAQDMENDRKELEKGIRRKYRNSGGIYDAEQLAAAIRQMETNIDTLTKRIGQEHKEIRRYRDFMAECEKRDRELVANGFEPGNGD